jgi:Uma2 family endonuclease
MKTLRAQPGGSVRATPAPVPAPAPSRSPSPAPVPELHSGDRLTQAEFHRLYSLQPPHVRAELINGIVYMSSPQRDPHGIMTIKVGTVLELYSERTPGTLAGNNTTTILGEDSEPQPDLHLRLLPEFGGRARLDEEEYVVGPPELVVEVSHSTAAVDLHLKKEDYRKAGVREYLVVLPRPEPGQLRGFDLENNRERNPDRQGVWKSRVFPGLWIDGPGLLAGDTTRLRRTLELGLATPQHAAFVKRLNAFAAKAAKAEAKKSAASERSARKGKPEGRR